ncbi:MAG: diaminopimelate decarboxylase [Patescibacteria group bacterium]
MKFLTADQVRAIAQQFGTPTYVYSEEMLNQAAKALLDFPAAFGLVVRYAMKACPNRAVLQLVNQLDLHFDASSGFEVHRALAAGIKPNRIQLTCQELPADLFVLALEGVRFNACSLDQLRQYGQMIKRVPVGNLAAGRKISIRVNPGLGSGHCGKTNVGGPSSSFGIWHEQLEEAKAIARQYGLKIRRLHTHIGSGSDPEIWVKVAGMALNIAKKLPDVKEVSLGGGQKIGRMPDEPSIDLPICGQAISELFQTFATATGRKLQLEIEPGTYVVARAGCLIAQVVDVVSTKPDPNGQVFVKVNTGMTEVARPTLYGAQHLMEILPKEDDDSRQKIGCVISGHCCESGDVLTPAPGDPNTIAVRELLEAEIGDFLIVEDTGAYCEGMNCAGYNSFPAAASVLVRDDGTLLLIRRRQTLEQLMQNEIGLNQ